MLKSHVSRPGALDVGFPGINPSSVAGVIPARIVILTKIM